eukprot:5144351-Pyramimonas_sp.AAC.1
MARPPSEKLWQFCSFKITLGEEVSRESPCPPYLGATVGGCVVRGRDGGGGGAGGGEEEELPADPLAPAPPPGGAQGE